MRRYENEKPALDLDPLKINQQENVCFGALAIFDFM